MITNPPEDFKLLSTDQVCTQREATPLYNTLLKVMDFFSYARNEVVFPLFYDMLHYELPQVIPMNLKNVFYTLTLLSL